MRIACVALLAAAFFLSVGAAPGLSARGPLVSMERKLEHIENNGASAHPDPSPTELTEDEVNAYFTSGNMDLPAGVESIHFRGEAGVVTATAQVDFDRLKGASNSNPLLAIFTGVHAVVVVVHAHGSGGGGFAGVDSVSLDNVEIPRFVLQLFVSKYLQPKYPDIGLDSRFKLPNRIATATVGEHKLTIVQR